MKNFFKSLLSQNGKISSNRFFSMLTLAYILLASIFLTVSTGAIPPIDDSWIYILGIFIGGSLGGKATDAYKGKTTEEPTEGQQ